MPKIPSCVVCVWNRDLNDANASVQIMGILCLSVQLGVLLFTGPIKCNI